MPASGEQDTSLTRAEEPASDELATTLGADRTDDLARTNVEAEEEAQSYSDDLEEEEEEEEAFSIKHTPIEELLKKKQEGNELYKKGTLFSGHTVGKDSLIQASVLYYDILKALEGNFLFSERQGALIAEVEGDESEKWKDLKKTILLNLAACSLKMDSPDSCLNCCDSVLEMEPGNQKALYRKGQGYLLAEDLKAAEEAFVSCVRVNPNNKAARKEIKSIRSLIKKREEKERFEEETRRGRERLEQEAPQAGSPDETSTTRNAASVVKDDRTMISQDTERLTAFNEETVEEGCNITEEWLQGNSFEVSKATLNGAIVHQDSEQDAAMSETAQDPVYSYAWSQTLKELTLIVRLQHLGTHTNLSVELGRNSVEITFTVSESKSPQSSISLRKRLIRPILPGEATWQLEEDQTVPGSAGKADTSKYLVINLHKDNSNYPMERAKGSRQAEWLWWQSVFEGDATIDVSTQCSIPDDELSELPDSIKRQWERNIVEGIETGEIKDALEEERRVKERQQQIVDEKESREQNNERAKKNPSKKALLEMMQENFPDIPVEIR